MKIYLAFLILLLGASGCSPKEPDATLPPEPVDATRPSETAQIDLVSAAEAFCLSDELELLETVASAKQLGYTVLPDQESRALIRGVLPAEVIGLISTKGISSIRVLVYTQGKIDPEVAMAAKQGLDAVASRVDPQVSTGPIDTTGTDYSIGVKFCSVIGQTQDAERLRETINDMTFRGQPLSLKYVSHEVPFGPANAPGPAELETWRSVDGLAFVSVLSSSNSLVEVSFSYGVSASDDPRSYRLH
jgi:hypothetical protein